MGKSGNRKKKVADPSPPLPAKVDSVATKKPAISSPATATDTPAAPEVPPFAAAPLKVEHFAAVFLRRAHELKEEGNRRFQSKDYHGAMNNYEQALRLTPRNHPDRAVFHSNRAACLMQMKPVQYETVVRECSLALEAHPRFGRALFRRARALEALGKLDFALQDVQLLLQADGNNPDALELAKRLRVAIRNREEAHQDTHMHGRRVVTPAVSAAAPYAGTSPAALGASVVNGSPVASKGSPKPLPKKKGGKPEQPCVKVSVSDARQDGLLSSDVRQSSLSPSMSPAMDTSEHVCMGHTAIAHGIMGSLQNKASKGNATQPQETWAAGETAEKPHAHKPSKPKAQVTLPSRPLKLIYDHDIRLAQMPRQCKFCDLRELVRKRFPSSKAVLIKYRDMEGDLVTITSTEELRLAEAAVLAEAEQKKTHTANTQEELGNSGSKSAAVSSALEPLRLHVVEVTAEQEPVVEEEEDDTITEGTDNDSEESCLFAGEGDGEDSADPSLKDLSVDSIRKDERVENGEERNDKDGEENKGKEIEIDDWLLDFAHLFRTHIGVDPDAHIDLHELGMELCSEALEETVTSEDAQPLFETAACKFQEVAALAFFNWGNVHMCAARKQIPLEGTSDEGEFRERLQVAYDWAQGQYEQARMKYEEALRVKPDFYEGVLALGQESFESAKLRWSLAVASQVDLTTWDSSETLGLFSNAEERMQVAVGMWEKLEERRLKEAKGCPHVKKDVLNLEARSHREAPQELLEAETQEQFLVMRFQINLFWGNILFENSQVEYKLGLPSWKSLLDEAVQKFELAGASPTDIAVVLKNHVSNSTCSCEATKPASEVSSTSGNEGNIKAQENRDIGTHSQNSVEKEACRCGCSSDTTWENGSFQAHDVCSV